VACFRRRLPHEFKFATHRFKAILAQPFQPFKNPYMFAYALSFSVMLHYARGNPAREPIELIFDEDVIKRKQAEAAYKEMFKVYPSDVTDLLGRKEPRFENDKQFNPLQAADLLAYCVRARYETDPSYEDVRKSPIYTALAGGEARGPYPGGLYLIGNRTILIEITDEQMNDFKHRVAARQKAN